MTIDFNKLDLERLGADLVPVLVSGIEHLVEGTAEDIQEFARAISEDLFEAQLTGQSATTDQLMDQLILLAEIQSIRVRNNSWALFTAVVSAIFRAAGAALVAVVF